MEGRLRVKESVWWLGISFKIESMLRNFSHCVKHRSDTAEPLKSSLFPDYPWQKITHRPIHIERKRLCSCVLEYSSRYTEVAKLESTSSPEIISHLKSIFGCHGIPEVFMSDNEPQFSSIQFKN